MIKFKELFNEDQCLKNEIVSYINDDYYFKNFSYTKRLIYTILLSFIYMILLQWLCFFPSLLNMPKSFWSELDILFLSLIIYTVTICFILISFGVSRIAINVNQFKVIKPGLYCYILPFGISIAWILVIFTDFEDRLLTLLECIPV